MEIVQFVDSRLSVRIQINPPFLVSELEGTADHTGHGTLREWMTRIAEEAEPVIVVEMGSLAALSEPAASTLCRGLREAQRQEKGVRLVRCREADFTRLREAGLRGEIWHCGSLAQATEGKLGEADAVTRLHLSPESSSLRRLELLMGSITRQLHFLPSRAEAIRAAVVEATVDAIEHDRRRGSERRISLYLHRLPDQLVIEVQKHGPSGASTRAGEAGALLRRLGGEVEFLPNPTGLLTRLVVRYPPDGERS